MRFLHLSDLHLGKRVNEFSMLEDHAYILKEILNIIDEQKVEAVLIAGDIYDKVIPSAEAVRLLDDFLTRIAARELPVFLISGNHDSAERIAFGSRLMSSRQIYLSPVFESDVEPVTISDRYGEINIYMLPFVKPSLVKRVYPEEEIITYQDAVNAAVQHMQIDTDKRNILLAHQFVTGAARCDSEELSVGGVDDVDASVFENTHGTSIIQCLFQIKVFIQCHAIFLDISLLCFGNFFLYPEISIFNLVFLKAFIICFYHASVSNQKAGYKPNRCNHKDQNHQVFSNFSLQFSRKPFSQRTLHNTRPPYHSSSLAESLCSLQ